VFDNMPALVRQAIRAIQFGAGIGKCRGAATKASEPMPDRERFACRTANKKISARKLHPESYRGPDVVTGKRKARKDWPDPRKPKTELVKEMQAAVASSGSGNTSYKAAVSSKRFPGCVSVAKEATLPWLQVRRVMTSAGSPARI